MIPALLYFAGVLGSGYQILWFFMTIVWWYGSKRESGENPELTRSGKGERRPQAVGKHRQHRHWLQKPGSRGPRPRCPGSNSPEPGDPAPKSEDLPGTRTVTRPFAVRHSGLRDMGPRASLTHPAFPFRHCPRLVPRKGRNKGTSMTKAGLPQTVSRPGHVIKRDSSVGAVRRRTHRIGHPAGRRGVERVRRRGSPAADRPGAQGPAAPFREKRPRHRADPGRGRTGPDLGQPLQDGARLHRVPRTARQAAPGPARTLVNVASSINEYLDRADWRGQRQRQPGLFPGAG